MDIAIRLAGKVLDPVGYRRGVDEAQQFYRSHTAWLRDLRSGGGLAEQKRMVEVRQTNMRSTERLYIVRQREALDDRLHPAPGKLPLRGAENG